MFFFRILLRTGRSSYPQPREVSTLDEASITVDSIRGHTKIRHYIRPIAEVVARGLEGLACEAEERLSETRGSEEKQNVYPALSTVECEVDVVLMMAILYL